MTGVRAWALPCSDGRGGGLGERLERGYERDWNAKIMDMMYCTGLSNGGTNLYREADLRYGKVINSSWFLFFRRFFGGHESLILASGISTNGGVKSSHWNGMYFGVSSFESSFESSLLRDNVVLKDEGVDGVWD